MGYLSIFTQTEFLSAVVGAVVGGLIAALVAFWTQNRVFQEEKRLREQSTWENNKALSRSLFLKLTKIYSNIYRFQRSIEEHFERVPESRHKHPSLFVIPIGNMPEKVYLSTEELSFCLEYTDDELFDSIVSMGNVHNAAISGMNTFVEMRREVNVFIEPFVGEDGVINIDHIYRKPSVIGRVEGLDNFILEMRQGLQKDVDEYRKTVDNFCQLIREKFEFNKTIKFRG